MGNRQPAAASEIMPKLDNLVIQAYNKAESKDFFAITEVLEKLLRRRYAADDPRFAVTTGQVRQVLASNKLTFSVT